MEVIVPIDPSKPNEACLVRSSSARAFFAIELFDQASQLAALGRREASALDQVREERRQRPAAKRVGDGPQPAADQLTRRTAGRKTCTGPVRSRYDESF